MASGEYGVGVGQKKKNNNNKPVAGKQFNCFDEVITICENN